MYVYGDRMPPSFPSTALFRSGRGGGGAAEGGGGVSVATRADTLRRADGAVGVGAVAAAGCGLVLALAGAGASSPALAAVGGVLRSEEHTSELQSREHLVCRLL